MGSDIVLVVKIAVKRRRDDTAEFVNVKLNLFGEN